MPDVTDTFSTDALVERFVAGVQGREDRLRQTQRQAINIVQDKQKILLPVREFLHKLMDLGVVVANADRFGALRHLAASPQHFEVYENDSSPSWEPGVSLFFDHPGKVEISVPNKTDIPQWGLVVIRCVTPVPDNDILEGPFRTAQQACEALAEFLSRHTERIGKAPK